ncbi:MAG: aminoglycoside phosphotransferase family protein [Bacillaceae bacterium]|nr:aminoglycoside phosphotransferase family protein [Bacillaceae bacterium]
MSDCTIPVTEVLKDLQIPCSSFREVRGGEASSVYQVKSPDGEHYALRVLPEKHDRHFRYEQSIMKYVQDKGIPVPRVHQVKKWNQWAVMLMEWLPGNTMLQSLMKFPEKAFQLGMVFGKMQYNLHQIPPAHIGTQNWLTPETEEERKLFHQVRVKSGPSVILHLDYHPLNVMIDGHNVTGIIDWTNCSIGDRRFDIARTLSILRLEGSKLFEDNSVIQAFEEGYIQGYDQMDNLGDLSLFLAWAGFRMMRDLSGRKTADELMTINEWSHSWIREK